MARDPERRKRILSLIEQIWSQDGYADMRIIQLLCNVAEVNGDPYFTEDTVVEAGLTEWLERVR